MGHVLADAYGINGHPISSRVKMEMKYMKWHMFGLYRKSINK